MKRRIGWVSNSSTTSFCICGISREEDELMEMLKIKVDEEEEGDSDVGESLYEYCEKNGLDSQSIPDAGEYYIGLEIDKMKDDETLAQFKARIIEKLKDFKPKKDEVTIVVDAYSDC